MLPELSGLFFLMAVQVVIPPIPAELIVIGAGREYGLLLTTLVAGSGLFAGSVLVYFFGEWIEARFGRFFKKERVASVMARLHRIETPLLLIRVLPYNPADLISYAAGILRVPLRKYLILTFVVTYLRCGLLAYFGTRITDLKSLFIILSLLALSAMTAAFFVYGRRR